MGSAKPQPAGWNARWHRRHLQTRRGKPEIPCRKAGRIFSDRKIPPAGNQPYTGAIAGDQFTGKSADGTAFTLTKVDRVSKTMGAKPPEGAKILFDGSHKDAFIGGRVDEKTQLLNTDGQDIKTKDTFNNYTMHLEFMLPFKPAARGQGRGNSGFYQVDHYEVQILDSFGLEGENNECGGVYTKAKPLG
ncbi:MAG: DUF1080 domain-containing protein [Verrucomicrobiales bacterium]